MGVYLPNMEMPTSCWECPFQDCGNCTLNAHKAVDRGIIEDCIDDDCPLVPVPPHGRLIDADALMRHKGDCYDAEGHLLYAVGTGNILCAPTIIPTEEGKT